MKTLITLLTLFCLVACQKSPVNFEGGDPNDHEAEMSVSAVHALPPLRAESTEKVAPVTDRKLIKTGYLNIIVENVGETKDKIEQTCKAYGAYVSSETQSNYQTKVEYNQVIRVPAAHFDDFVKKIEALSTKVENKNIETTDVTEEFIDKEARIKTKKELENRYREILKQAKEVSDMLSIEAQLNHVRADIEAMEGRLNYLRNQTAFSTLTLSYYEPVGAESAFGSKTIAAFTNGWDMLLIFLLGLVNIWPFMLLIAIVLYFAIRRTRQRNTKPDTEVSA